MGALSELLPALPTEDQPRILVGTSVGALNCAYLAATADRPLDERLEKATAFWKDISWEQVLEPLLSHEELGRAWAYVRELTGHGARLASLLDPAPLRETLAGQFKFARIDRNVRDKHLDVAAVVCTAGATSLSVVFHDGGETPEADPLRGVEYVPTPLAAEHVLGSAAVPGLFPAVQVQKGPRRGWYSDGGTRLNTPVKPALELGAERVIVVALNSLRPRRAAAAAQRPDALEGAAQIIQGLLVDPLVNDVHSLARTNELILDGHLSGERKLVPYILIAPRDPDEIGRIAADVYERHYSKLRDVLRSDLARVGRLVDAGASAVHGELFSYLCFASEFAGQLIELGRRDARTWLTGDHDAGVWEHRVLPS
jgi:NTE family protein